MCRLTGWTLSLILGASLALQAGDKLSDAAANGDIQWMKAQVAAGEGINDVDGWGWTALMWATLHGQDSAARWLLNKGADPNIKSTIKTRFLSKGTTALAIAARESQEGLVAALLAFKADPNTADEAGNTPLSHAKASHSDLCISLLQGGPTPPSPLHTSTHRVIQEKLNDLFILIQSGVTNSQAYLGKVKAELDTELDKQHVRHLVCIVDPLNLDDEQELAAKRDAFKPRYFLGFYETAADVKTSLEGMPRCGSDFYAALNPIGAPAPVWVKQISVTESRSKFNAIGTVHRDVTGILLGDLEADLLLQP